MKNKNKYPDLIKNGDLAELIGVTIGDGHIWKYPRSEELSIFSNATNLGFINRYSQIIETVFSKKPAITKHTKAQCTRIRIYQNYIQRRLGVPYSPRQNKVIKIPGWIFENNQYIVRYLRGLYEAEGSFCVHTATHTHKLFFTNKNTSVIKNVMKSWEKLGFHPHRSDKNFSVQISKKDEVYRAIELLQFRMYK